MVGRWLYRIEAVLLFVAVLATFAMMCLTTADAVSRYALNSPVLGALELTEKYLIVAAIFLGLSYAYRGGLFIRVTLFVDRLPPRGRLIADGFAHLVTVAFCVFVLFASTRQAVRGWSDDTQLSTLPILVGPAYSFVPIGFLALTVILVADFMRLMRGHRLLASEEAPTVS